MSIPHIERKNGHPVLMVHDKPMILLAGEVHNSAASSLQDMEAAFEKADLLNLNTVILPVYWEQIEQEEGVFDFGLFDQILDRARVHDKKLVLTWFGSWKNGQCFYAPAWVKQASKRFPRAEVIKGQKSIRDRRNNRYSTLSAFGEETKKADAIAFSALMRHIKEVDETDNTVVMVQVENETGLLEADRDHCDRADALFEGQVPKQLIKYLNQHFGELPKELQDAFVTGKEGSWTETFGKLAAEVFQSWHTARFVEEAASCGKQEYPLPMFVNCWLDKGQQPGRYPTGGPVYKMMPVWKAAAPSIDAVAPDIYVPTFHQECEKFTEMDNPHLIAECTTHSLAGLREIYCVGHHHAICYSPFGYEDIGHPFSILQGILFGMDTSDPALSHPQSIEEYAAINAYLQGLMPKLTEAYGTKKLQAVSKEEGLAARLVFDKFDFDISFDHKFMPRKNGVFLALQEKEYTFWILHTGCIFDIESLNSQKPYAEFLSVEEGIFENGAWKPVRGLNGDELMTPGSQTVTLYRATLSSF